LEKKYKGVNESKIWFLCNIEELQRKFLIPQKKKWNAIPDMNKIIQRDFNALCEQLKERVTNLPETSVTEFRDWVRENQ